MNVHSDRKSLVCTKFFFFVLIFVFNLNQGQQQCDALDISDVLPDGNFVIKLALQKFKLLGQSALQELIQKLEKLDQDSTWQPSKNGFHIPFLSSLSSVKAVQTLNNLQREFPAIFQLVDQLATDSILSELLDLVLHESMVDLRSTIPQMIESRGFKLETHDIITQDCYILRAYRVIHPDLKDEQKRRPILLQHGLLSTPADFLMNSPKGHVNDTDNHNLAFALAKLGYDVWLPNSRGNSYSLNHTQFNFDQDKKYWQFTFDEMAKFDLPATIAYVQNWTKQDTVGYVGHSQGTLIMFQLLASRPEMSAIVQPFIALAPVFQLKHIRTPLRLLAFLEDVQQLFLRYPNRFLDLKSVPLWSLLVELLCQTPTDYVCSNLYFLFGGYDPLQLNVTRIPVYLSNYPAGTSNYNLVHYAQLIRGETVRWFDYQNEQDNLACYNSKTPPEIDLKKIDSSSQITLISSLNDWLADQKDVQFIRDALTSNQVKFVDHIVTYKDWNHFDFVLGIENDIYVNNLVIKELQKYDNLTAVTGTTRLQVFNENTCNVKAKCYLNHSSLIV